MKKHHCALLALLLWGSTLHAAAAEDQEEAVETEVQDQESGLAGPEFKDEGAKARFEKGKSLFKGAKYKEAEKEFKASLRGAKSKTDKDLVRKWQSASRYAPMVERIRSIMQRKQLQVAYGQLLQLRPRFQGTPAMGLWEATALELEGLLFQPLETFDYKKSGYSAKYGKTFISDPQVVFKGKRCLRWMSTSAATVGQLKVKSVPRDWTPYDALEIWIRTASTVPAEVFIITEKAAADKKFRPSTLAPAGTKVVSSFMTSVTFSGGRGLWKPYRLTLKEFKSQGQASLAAVKEFLIQIRGGRRFDMLVDEIRLMRKDPSKKTGKTRRGRK